MSIVDTQEEAEQEEFASLDELSTEVSEPDVQEEEIEAAEAEIADLPDKFRGKSTEDIVKSYTQLEQEFGRRNNEVGELRKLTDELLNLQLSEKKEKDEPDYELNVDNLLDNPQEAISRAVENHPKFKQFEEAQRTASVGQAKASFEEKHPDYQDLVSSEDFGNWVRESPVRSNMYREANENYDFAVGDELFTTYKALRGQANFTATEEKSSNAKQALKKASVERGSGQGSTKKVYRRADLINLKLSNPAKYAAMDSEIMKAYEEGRVR
tara:strand:+ start:1737 stop:2543 length:807 start_codon:yes stop_codon:yes gene_type:complete